MNTLLQKLDYAIENKLIPYHENIINILTDQSLGDAPNLLLYGAEGFPFEWLWRTAARRSFGPSDHKNCISSNQWHYIDAGYYFEIDFKNPHQPKDSHSICDFLKEIITHTCHHSDRHIILLRNIDTICQKGELSLRVILERFWKNVWFICTTHHLGNIESPIRSRFCHLRVPLPTMNELRAMYANSLPPAFYQTDNRNLVFAHYLSLFHDQNIPSPISIDILCQFRAPMLAELLNDPKKNPTIEQIRTMTQQLTVHSISIRDLLYDLLPYCPMKKRLELLLFACNIDQMCAMTEGYRRPLYLEWLLHTAIYGIANL